MTETILLFDGDGAEPLDALGDRPKRLRGTMLLWIDLPGASPDDVRRIASEFGLDDESVGRLVDPSGGVLFRDKGAYVHVTASAPGPGSDDEASEIECVVGDNWVITAHERPAGVLDDFAELAQGSGRIGDLNGASFLSGLLDWVLGEHAAAFEQVEEELEQLDSRGMRGAADPDDDIEHLVRLRLHVGRLRRSLTSHRAILLALAHPELDALCDDASARRFEALIDRYELTLQGARDARESIYGSFDVLIARTGHRTNEIVKLLTLVSVTFLPGALIAGIMGMNFKSGVFTHPELFWVTVAAITSIAATTLVVAKLRDWV